MTGKHVSVTTLVQSDIHVTYAKRWERLQQNNFMVLSKQSTHGLPKVRISGPWRGVMQLGKDVETLVCRTIQNQPIAAHWHVRGSKAENLPQVLMAYKQAITKCTTKPAIILQKPLEHKIEGYTVKGVVDVVLNQHNIMEIKHTKEETGVDQLIHYAILHYLSTGKYIRFITLCNTCLGYVRQYRISNDFYTNGLALRYLQDSLHCWLDAVTNASANPKAQTNNQTASASSSTTVTADVATVKVSTTPKKSNGAVRLTIEPPPRRSHWVTPKQQDDVEMLLPLVLDARPVKQKPQVSVLGFLLVCFGCRNQ